LGREPQAEKKNPNFWGGERGNSLEKERVGGRSYPKKNLRTSKDKWAKKTPKGRRVPTWPRSVVEGKQGSKKTEPKKEGKAGEESTLF